MYCSSAPKWQIDSHYDNYGNDLKKQASMFQLVMQDAGSKKPLAEEYTPALGGRWALE